VTWGPLVCLLYIDVVFFEFLNLTYLGIVLSVIQIVLPLHTRGRLHEGRIVIFQALLNQSLIGITRIKV
jgi:hypothetical protein